MNHSVLSRMLGIVLLSVIFNPGTSYSQDDHPLISRYDGSEMADKKVAEFDAYKLVTGRTDEGDFQGEALEGKVTRIVYRNPADRSTLEIFTNFKSALEASGAAALYTCALDDCGPAYARSAWNRYNGLFAAADGDPRYLASKLSTDLGTAYVALMVGRTRTQVDVIEIVEMEGDLVVADAGALAAGLDEHGKVSVYGILFDVEEASIKPESGPALNEIASLLKERPALRLFVVGHTDMTGTLDHNRPLSEARARAVAQALVDEYDVETDRLEGYGVGPLAPVASNATEAGRRKNRRVELVVR